MNVQGWLTAASLATQAPGGKIVAARLFAPSLRADPVSRQRLIDFQPDMGHRFNALTSSKICFAVQIYSNKNTDGQVWLVRLKIADVFP
ncbi:hypothetical protein GHT40_19300 [Citrobacter werkmanii]|uniref:hypothetical protein n=1 Tax=Citrobacter werkmanii TaxID=67827 RepID=UPI0018FF2236|nr:hypothetical protein [Citrobacter werkmanii]MBJ9296451.1 hypothetical protein [Citrobacter werkmanii]